MSKQYKKIMKELEITEQNLENLQILDNAVKTQEVVGRRWLPFRSSFLYEGDFQIDKETVVKLIEDTSTDITTVTIKIIDIKAAAIITLPTVDKKDYRDFYFLWKAYPKEMTKVYKILSQASAKDN